MKQLSTVDARIHSLEAYGPHCLCLLRPPCVSDRWKLINCDGQQSFHTRSPLKSIEELLALFLLPIPDPDSVIHLYSSDALMQPYKPCLSVQQLQSFRALLLKLWSADLYQSASACLLGCGVIIGITILIVHK